jgi:hypothetical protein
VKRTRAEKRRAFARKVERSRKRAQKNLAADAVRRLGSAQAWNMTPAEIAESINAGKIPDGITVRSNAPVVACVIPAHGDEPESIAITSAEAGRLGHAGRIEIVR